MARPKHRTKPGGTYFVTTDTSQRRALFRNPTAAKIVEEKLFAYRDEGFYFVHHYGLMPEHLHVILTPGKATTLEKAMQLIKGGSSHETGKRLPGRFPVWQAGFTEHLIRDQADYDAHVRYIDRNSVKAGLASEPEDYPFCSAHGRYELDPWPVTSGAKAPRREAEATAGLKPRPSQAQSGNRVHYFACGSNLLKHQMRERIGIWHSAHRARLFGWEFFFTKARDNGTSAANIQRGGRDPVWGVVYEITGEQFRKLETYEKGYHVEDEVEVVLDDGSPIQVQTFIADSDKVKDRLVPAQEYLQKILRGAEEHSLPQAYRDEIIRKAKRWRKGRASAPP